MNEETQTVEETKWAIYRKEIGASGSAVTKRYSKLPTGLADPQELLDFILSLEKADLDHWIRDLMDVYWREFARFSPEQWSQVTDFFAETLKMSHVVVALQFAMRFCSDEQEATILDKMKSKVRGDDIAMLYVRYLEEDLAKRISKKGRRLWRRNHPS